MALQNNSLELLLKKAEENEKKYEWLQASKSYKKASEILSKEKKFANAAELAEHLGHCYYKASDQAKTNIDYRKQVKQAVQAYRTELRLLEKTIVEDKQVRIDHVSALISLVEAVLEKNLLKKKKLLDEWWTLENKVILSYEKIGDLSSAGKVCNELLEHSRSHRFWLASNVSELGRNQKEYGSLAEKAIQIFSQLDDDYELTRAYFLATYYYNFGRTGFGGSLEMSEDMKEQFLQKARGYSKKALELSHKTGDPWLIGESYRSRFWIIQSDQALENSTLAMEGYEKAIEYGKIAKNNYVITGGTALAANLLIMQAGILEDPDKQKENLKQGIKLIQKAKRFAEITENTVYLYLVYRDYNKAVNDLASIETDPKTKQELLEMATKGIEEGMKRLQGWKLLSVILLATMSKSLQLISKTKSEITEKKKLLQKSKQYIKNFLVIHKEMMPLGHFFAALGYQQLAQAQNDLAMIETNDNLKIKLLKRAAASMENAIRMEEKVIFFDTKMSLQFYGISYDFLGNLLAQINLLSKKDNVLLKAIDSYQKATRYFEKAEMSTPEAESHWHLAQLHDKIGEYQKATKNHELAAEAYDLSSKKISQLSEFYSNYSKYMLAWSQIEQAKYFHSIEDYSKAKEYYEKAANLHELAKPWGYLATNYFAWASMEEAEGLSRRENTQQAKEAFQKALEQFVIAEKSIKRKIEKIKSSEEKDLSRRLLISSDLRRRFCQARIQIEQAKLLDREGQHLQSSKSYGESAQKLGSIIKKTDAEAEQKELKYLAVLCQAWEKMAVAEETTSSASYLDAAELFEEAKDHCYTKKASLWALGNSSFCKGLAAGINYQNSLSLRDHAEAKGHIKSAATRYFQAGFKHASEYAKATQRLFDAYLAMNQAEVETDQEKRARQYQMAENLLMIAAGSFMKANQPEKTAQVKDILATVKEEKALAASLNDVMHAPTIASSTMSFTAPTPTSEASVGLEQFQHANVQANLIAGMKEVKVGESFCLSVEFVNAGKEPALLTRVEDFVPPDFIIVKKPEIYRLEDSCLNMKGKQIAPLKLVEAKVVLQPSKKGVYHLSPVAHYLDEEGQKKSLQLKSVEIKVEEVVLADRVSTGTKELDSLLLGGIPNGYSVVLTGPPSDERATLIKNFLEAGIKDDQVVFYVATEADKLESYLENSNFHLFLCNPKPKTQIPDQPNITKLRSKTDINNLNMALARESRNLQTQQNPKRLCIEIISDVLLEYGATTTRKWVSELLTDLGSKSFTILSVLDPEMHPSDQSKAIINLFDGEINLYQTGVPPDCKKSLIIKKLSNQDYIKNPICLTT